MCEDVELRYFLLVESVVSSLLYLLQRLQRYDRGIALVPSNDETIGHIKFPLHAAGDQASKIARGSEVENRIDRINPRCFVDMIGITRVRRRR